MKRHILLFGLLLAIAGNAVSQEPIAMDGKRVELQSGVKISKGATFKIENP